MSCLPFNNNSSHHNLSKCHPLITSNNSKTLSCLHLALKINSSLSHNPIITFLKRPRTVQSMTVFTPHHQVIIITTTISRLPRAIRRQYIPLLILSRVKTPNLMSHTSITIKLDYLNLTYLNYYFHTHSVITSGLLIW